MKNLFRNALLRKMCDTVGHWYVGNEGRIPLCLKKERKTEGDVSAEPSHNPNLSRTVINRLKKFINRFIYARKIQTLDLVGLNTTWNLLEDEASRETLVTIMAFRLMGSLRIYLPLNEAKYWKEVPLIEENQDTEDSIQVPLVQPLRKTNLQCIDLDVCLYTTAMSACVEFIHKQYEYCSESVRIKVESGDIVLDCGACYGDTALFFALSAGETGKVYSFECIRENMQIMRKNLELNPRLANSIQIVDRALSDKSDEILSFCVLGAGSFSSERWKRDTQGMEQVTATTAAIDDFMYSEHLPRVDFIKMDIEGAELSALQGAEKTIRTFKPKLAICVYHKTEDFVQIPDFLHRIVPEYHFYLKHCSICQEETVLFATVD